jgi:hypothetical protein
MVAVAALVLVAALLLRQAPGSPGGSAPSGSAPAATATAGLPTATPTGSIPTASPQTPPSPSASPLSADATAALAAATTFESARAAGRWTEAWAVLSADSRTQFGSLAAFAQAEGAYNAGGGTTFTMATPTQDPDLLSPTYLGNIYAEVAAHADIARAWLVFANHPNIRGASAGSEGLLVAPVGGQWLVWIAH